MDIYWCSNTLGLAVYNGIIFSKYPRIDKSKISDYRTNCMRVVVYIIVDQNSIVTNTRHQNRS